MGPLGRTAVQVGPEVLGLNSTPAEVGPPSLADVHPWIPKWIPAQSQNRTLTLPYWATLTRSAEGTGLPAGDQPAPILRQRCSTQVLSGTF